MRQSLVAGQAVSGDPVVCNAGSVATAGHCGDSNFDEALDGIPITHLPVFLCEEEISAWGK